MKQIKYIIFNLLFIATTILSSCNSILDDESIISNEQQQIEVRFTRSSLNDVSSVTSGTLVFWKETLNDLFNTQIDDLNKYSDSKYNTGEVYPNDNTTVYATGFSPANMQNSNNFQTLTLSEEESGITDVCTVEEAIQGNRNSPFKETMNFEHTLTKIYFKVQRDQTMVGSRDVRKIKLTIPNGYLPIEWNWNAAQKKYEINKDRQATKNLIFEHEDIIVGTNTDDLGIAYLMLPTTNTGKLESLHLTAEILLTNSSTVEREINEELKPIQLYEKDNDTEVLNAQPGEAYEVCIRFQQNSFTLIARQMDNWEQGGLIYVPIKP